MTRRSRQRTIDIWPGFVDALGNLVIILMFVLLVFVLAQFFLGRSLSGKEEEVNILTAQISNLAEALKLEQQAGAQMRARIATLTAELGTVSSRARELEDRNQGHSSLTAQLTADIEALEALHKKLEQEIAEKDRQLANNSGQLTEQTRLAEQARTQAALLQQQLDTLNAEMAKLSEALEATEKINREQQVQISDLGRQLNRALATRVQELQKYRSEFFGRLREVLGDRSDVRIEGDRFVFQSEVLFASASADLENSGQEKLQRLATTLIDIARTIPPEINWILRIDGHTDSVPINTAQFRSNWELSSARAISVVNFLISQGIDPHRLAAAGFGEYQPLDAGQTPQARARNRRIEIKLDQR